MNLIFKYRFHFLSLALVACLGITSFVFLAREMILRSSQSKVFTRIEHVPETEVALVLGCRDLLSDGRPNLFFQYRMDAAAQLFHAGKVKHLLVSGDNHRVDYNEPEAMKKALIQKGVPAERIVCDYAGFSTLDSVVRAKEVFGQNELIVVSQGFHNRRAIFIGNQRGLEVYGYNAREVDAFNSMKTRLREELARVKTLLDVYVLDRQPHFLGDPIEIAHAQSTEPRLFLLHEN